MWCSFLLQTVCCISSNMYHCCHHFLLSCLHHICHQQPEMVYIKMWNRQVIYKKYIWMSHVMTKIFTYMNFYTVNMNYLWNDIYTYYVEWYIPTVLSSAKQTVSGHSFVCSSTCTYHYTNYCNSNQKSYSQYPKWQISAYWDIGSNIIYVMIKHINQFILWSLKSTMRYNDMYNNFYTYEIFKWKMT